MNGGAAALRIDPEMILGAAALKDMVKKEEKLIEKLFLSSLAAFSLSMLTASLGSLVDGLIIGNTMDTHCVAAFGLISPLNFTFALIGSILDSGMSNSCAKALGENDPEKARSLFSVVIAAGVALSVIVMIIVLFGADAITVFLGADHGSEMFLSAKKYLVCYVYGLPAITATKLLSSIMQLDSDRRRIVASTMAMTAANVVGDLLCVYVFHAGLAEIALVTTISYYVGVIVLMLHFRRENTIFRLVFRNLEWKSLGGIIHRGLPKGVSRLTSTANGIFINRAAAGIAATAVAAYAVQSNVTYLTNTVVMGIAQTFMILASMYYGEENKKALERVTAIACRYELFFTGLISAALFVFARFAAKLYLGSNAEALDAAVISLRWFAAGLLFWGYNILFADYLQVIGKILPANAVYLIENILFTVAAVTVLKGRYQMTGLFAGIAAAHVLMFLSILAYVMVRNRRPVRRASDLLMLEESFGANPENEFAATVTSIEGAVAVSEDLIAFCKSRGVDHRTAGRLGLAAEELITNTIEHGSEDGKPHYIDVRAIYGQEGVKLIVRDDCSPFDPKERFRYLADDDPATNIGLRIIMNMARDLSYTSAMKLNNLTIKV